MKITCPNTHETTTKITVVVCFNHNNSNGNVYLTELVIIIIFNGFIHSLTI